MRALITGANGGFAKAFIPEARKYFDELYLTGRSPLNITNYIQCDLSDKIQVKNLLMHVRPEFIFNLAGSYSGDFATDMLNNVICTQQLLDIILSEKIKCRTILLGSAAEYGLILPKENPVIESHPLNPVSHYGFSKATQTHLGMYYSTIKELDIVIARVFNLKSSGLSTRLFIGKIEKLISDYKHEKIDKITVRNLDAERDYIDSTEAAKQIIMIAKKGKSGSVYNVGTGKPILVRSILAEMLNMAGLDMSCVVEDGILNAGNEVCIPSIFANMNKTFSLIG